MKILGISPGVILMVLFRIYLLDDGLVGLVGVRSWLLARIARLGDLDHDMEKEQ